MSKEAAEYHAAIDLCFTKIRSQTEAFARAAAVCARAIKEDRLIHVIGPGGHSNLAAEEVLWRAGGLGAFNPILDAGFNLIHGATRTLKVERTPGYGRSILEAYRVGGEGEVLVIVNAYGINPLSIDCALFARERKMTSIGITGTAFAEKLGADHPSRHASGQNLYQIVDVFINSHLPYGDAVVSLEGVGQKLGPLSSFVNLFCINLLSIETAKALRAIDVDPPVWRSANLPGGDEFNRELLAKYGGRVKHLL